MKIGRWFAFCAAHSLPLVHASHKCGRVHGHNYRVLVEVRGEPTDMGWVRDFEELSFSWGVLASKLDHRTLNDIEGLENPTAETLALWIVRALREPFNAPPLRGLCAVEVWEGDKSFARLEIGDLEWPR